MKQLKIFKSGLFWACSLVLYVAVVKLAYCAPSNKESINIYMHTYSGGGSYLPGRAFLVPRPLESVSIVLQSQPAWFKGFEKQSGRVQTLSDYELENIWTHVYYQYNPQSYTTYKQARLRKLDEILAKKGITTDEHREWGDAISTEAVSESDHKTVNIPAEPIRREEFIKWGSGKTGVKGSQFYTNEYVVLLDVTLFLGHEGPLTLVWHGGQKTTSVRTEFKWSACLTGVMCFPSPHWETVPMEEEFISPAVRTALVGLAAKFGALPAEQVYRLNQAIEADAQPKQRRYDHQQLIETKVPFQSPRASFVDLTLYELSGVSYAIEANQPIKALADGRFFSTIGSPNPGGYILARTAGGIQVQTLSNSVEVDSTRVDGHGELWGLTVEKGAQQIGHYCLVKLDAQQLVMRNENRCMRNVLSPSWMMTPQGHAVLYAPYHMSVDTLETRLVDLTSSHAPIPMSPFFKLRNEAKDLTPPLEYSMVGTDGDILDLGDGLFWFSSNGLVGVSPETGKAQKSFPRVAGKGGIDRLVFGSRAGNWVLKTTTTANSEDVLRIHKLRDGLPVYDLPSDNTHAASARSARGHLLAYALSSSVLVWDMKAGTQVVNISIPAELNVLSIAFNWRGDELWILCINRKTDKQGIMIWPVPDALRDPADLHNVPDQTISDIGDKWRR